MTRIDDDSRRFYSRLSSALEEEHLSPEQIAALTKAVRALPAKAHLTDAELENVANAFGMTEPHKATLTFALLMHRYGGELRPVLEAQDALSRGVAGMLTGLLNAANEDESSLVSERLHAFYESVAGARAAVEESGLELFRQQAPSVSVHPNKPQIDVEIGSYALQFLESGWAKSLGFTDEDRSPSDYDSGHQRSYGTFLESGEGWVFRPARGEEKKRGEDVPLGRVGIQALELLAEAISVYIHDRAEQQDRTDPRAALASARDIGVANMLLVEVMSLLEVKQAEHVKALALVEAKLRDNLGDYRVQRLGREAVNALVGTLFPD